MANHLDTDSQPAMAELLNGIIHDAHDLVDKQLQLFQVEVKNEARKIGKASVPLILGGLLALVSVINLTFAGAYLASWVWPTFPLWGGLALMGAGVGLAAVILALVGKNNLDACNSGAEERLEILKEKFPWTTKK